MARFARWRVGELAEDAGTRVVFASDGLNPGLKVSMFGSVCRGLKPPVRSAADNYICNTRSLTAWFCTFGSYFPRSQNRGPFDKLRAGSGAPIFDTTSSGQRAGNRLNVALSSRLFFCAAPTGLALLEAFPARKRGDNQPCAFGAANKPCSADAANPLCAPGATEIGKPRVCSLDRRDCLQSMLDTAGRSCKSEVASFSNDFPN